MPASSGTKRWLRRGVLMALAIEVLYLVAANLFLNTSLARLIERKPEKFLVSWDRGWTVVPGLVHVRGLRLLGQSKSVQWQADLDSVRVFMRLTPLAGKRFLARQVDGEGLSFRLRERLGESEPAVQGTPPIPGLMNPPSRPPEELYPPPPPDQRRWFLQLDELEISNVREVWIDRYRFVGDGRLGGAFQVEIREALEITRFAIELESGSVVSGRDTIAEDVKLAVEGRLDPFIPRQEKGARWLRFLTGDVRVLSPRAGFKFLEHLFRRTDWLRIDGRGRLDVDIAVDQGLLAAGTRFAIEEASFEIGYLDFRTHGEGRIDGRVTDDPQPEIELDAVFTDFEVGRRRLAPYVSGSGFELRVRSPDLDLLAERPELSVEVELPPSEIADIRVYNAYLPAGSGLRLLSGEGEISGRLELSTVDGSGSGKFEVTGERITAGFGAVELIGDFSLESRLADADPEKRRFNLSGSRLDFDRVTVLEDGEPAGHDWWGQVKLPAGEIIWAEPLRLDARLQAELRDSRPLVALLSEKKPLLSWMEPLVVVEDLSLGANLRSTDCALVLSDATLSGEGLEIMADLHFDGDRPAGFFFFQRGPLSAAVELADGERDWKLFGSRVWYESQVASDRSVDDSCPPASTPDTWQ